MTIKRRRNVDNRDNKLRTEDEENENTKIEKKNGNIYQRIR